VELLAAGGFDEQRAEIRDVAEEVVGKLADALHGAVGESDAVDLLSQWEGFTRFCHDRLGLEPLKLTAAFGLGRDDVAAELAAAFPDAGADEAEAARWAAEWAEGVGPAVRAVAGVNASSGTIRPTPAVRRPPDFAPSPRSRSRLAHLRSDPTRAVFEPNRAAPDWTCKPAPDVARHT
jgi:hypothetical protein